MLSVVFPTLVCQLIPMVVQFWSHMGERNINGNGSTVLLPTKTLQIVREAKLDTITMRRPPQIALNTELLFRSGRGSEFHQIRDPSDAFGAA